MVLFYFVFVCWALIKHWFATRLKSKSYQVSSNSQEKPKLTSVCQPKPKWVIKEVIRLTALMPPGTGYRTIALVFNRLYEHKRKMTVGKTFVSYTIKAHLYEIQVLRRKLKHRKPRPLSKNLIWSLDLTQVSDMHNHTQTLFGIVDSGTRANLYLQATPNKASITLLRCVLETIERFGKPKIIRTDNEAVFTSRLFRFGLWFLKIKHQTSERACPWQNGKIERFFGTLKSKLRQRVLNNLEQLTDDLAQFRLWYNHVRPHQNLDGRTPAEVWNKQQPKTTAKPVYFQTWEGLLGGYYLPPN